MFTSSRKSSVCCKGSLPQLREVSESPNAIKYCREAIVTLCAIQIVKSDLIRVSDKGSSYHVTQL